MSENARYTRAASGVLQCADREAQRQNCDYIGTEHLLLGLVAVGGGSAWMALIDRRVDPEKVRDEVERVSPKRDGEVAMGPLPYTPRSRHVLELAQESATNRERRFVVTEDILIGLIREVDGIAAMVLRGFGITEETIPELHEIRDVRDPQAPPAVPGLMALPNQPPANVVRRDSDIMVGELRYIIGKDNPMIVEVGCNDCETTGQMLAVMPHARIICFEPDPRPFERNLLLTDPRVTIHRLAISDRRGTATFYQSGGKVPHSTAPCRDDWDYSGSICRPTGHLKRDKLVHFPTSIEVPTDTLDHIVGGLPIDLLFADVQGAEARLILGGQMTLRRTRWFYCEFYDVEQYERQPDLRALLAFLPDFDLIGTYANNALFLNREAT